MSLAAVTGARAACGWFDAVALRRAVLKQQHLEPRRHQARRADGLDTIRICIGYRIDGEIREQPPLLPHRYAEVVPVYEALPGWSEATAGITGFGAAAGDARRYLARMEELAGVPIEPSSRPGGRARARRSWLRHPFD